MDKQQLSERTLEIVHSPPEILGADSLFERAEVEAEAWQLIENRHEQPVVEVPRQERRDNARTAIMEAITESGHLSTVEITGSLEEINQQVLNRLLNGWSDTLPLAERNRRYAEICEELIIQRTFNSILEGHLPPDTAVGIVSDIPSAVIDGIGGYRYKNKKGMVRSTQLQANPDASYTRIITQVSRSNSGPATTFSYLESQEVTPESEYTPDVAALRAPFLHNYVDAAVGIQRRLDYFAGAGIRYGDKLTDKPTHASYENLADESKRREEDVEAYVDGLANLEEQLDVLVKQGMTRSNADQLYAEEVIRILDAICINNPEYVEATYGKKAVAVFDHVAILVARGEEEQAKEYLEEKGYLKEDVDFCGVTISIDEAREKGLDVNDLGSLLEKGIKWKKGYCRVEACPSKPKQTDVGPCSVCRRCQRLFNAGADPTKELNLKGLFSFVKKPDQDKVISLEEKRHKKAISRQMDEEDSILKVA